MATHLSHFKSRDDLQISCGELGTDEETGKAPKKGRRRRKGPAKAAQAPPEVPPTQGQGEKSCKKGKGKRKEVESSAAWCAVCGAEFPSRSKMFQHIKSTGHAAPKS